MDTTNLNCLSLSFDLKRKANQQSKWEAIKWSGFRKEDDFYPKKSPISSRSFGAYPNDLERQEKKKWDNQSQAWIKSEKERERTKGGKKDKQKASQ